MFDDCDEDKLNLTTRRLIIVLLVIGFWLGLFVGFDMFIREKPIPLTVL